MTLEVILVVVIAAIVAGAIGFFWARSSQAPPPAPPSLPPEVITALKDVGALKSLVEKLPSGVEVGSLAARVEGVEARVPSDLAGDMERLKGTLGSIDTEFRTRREFEEKNRAAIQKIEAVLVGAQSRGAAGEDVLAEAFSKFPPDMGDTQFKVNGKPVEFALILPNRKRLPIDSKWPAVKELELLAVVEDERQRAELLAKVEKNVLKKVEEVTKYLDAATTASFGVAAIPDAAYFACRTAHIDAYKQRVLLMPYSLTVPFLLALYNLHLQFARSIDQENLEAYLSQVDALLDQFENTLENSVQRGATLINNAYLELRGRISQMRGTLSTLRQLPTEALAEKQESLLKD